MAGAGFVSLDSPFAVQLRGDVGGAHIVVGVEAVRSGLLCVDVYVVHDEKRSARCDGAQQCALGVVIIGAQQGRVLGGHQVEGSWGKRGFYQARVHPPHPDLGVLGVAGSAFERHLRHIESGDVPPVLGEPDGVGTFAATDVEGLAWLESGYLADECAVGLAAPDLLHAGVTLIP